MKVTANQTGFANGQLRREGVEFDFDVEVREDGTNNLGKWMDYDSADLKKLEAAAKKKKSKSKSKAKEEEEAEEAVVTEID